MKFFNVILLVVPIAFAASSCGERTSAATGLRTDLIPVKTLPLEKTGSNAPIFVSGQFTTDDEVILSFKTGGVINQIFVKEGDAVSQGQVLATLHLTEINAQVQQAQLGVDKANRDYQRTLNLYKDSVATLEQVQNVRTGLELARQQLGAAQFNRGYAVIRAPKSGFVLKKMADAGQVVNAGTPVLQTNGAQSASWILKVGLSDAEWAAVKINDKAAIRMESAAGQQFEGIVARKSEGVDATSGSFTADIKLTGKRPEAVAAGMFGKAVITPSENTLLTQTNWSIPYDAILDGDGSTGYVFVTKDNKIAHKVKVTIAAMEKEKAIINEGLEGAGALIISGSAYLADNSAIKVIQ
jgi:RND family efflux transporter MFP subunit